MTQAQALSILKAGANVFLTGEPGAGKTHTINEYVRYLRSHKIEPAITASTGIAATHIGGMTIHSWSGMGINAHPSKYELDAIASREYIAKRINKAKVLIIDEVSMLPGIALETVHAICCAVKGTDEPFGGLQVIFVGDFFQLPPITRNDVKAGESTLTGFAYQASAWQQANPIVCYLTEQHRQDDGDFLNLLNAIRSNTFGGSHIPLLESRRVTGENVPADAPKLFSHNADVDRVNSDILSQLPGDYVSFRMSSQGPQKLVGSLTKGCLSPELLQLKVGAAVMFTKNNTKQGFVNGTLGTISSFDKVTRKPVVALRNGRTIMVDPMDWSVEENGRVRAKIMQLPLRLAWAITIHKSQGISLDEAVIDLGEVFEFGQGYVALSRVRRLTGLHLLSWNERAFQVHPDILQQDITFQEISRLAQEKFTQLKSDEVTTLHHNFIKVCGGRISVSENASSPTTTTGMRLEQIRQEFPNAYRPWNEEQDAKLKELFSDGKPVRELVSAFGRKRGAIRSRLIKLGLVKKEE